VYPEEQELLLYVVRIFGEFSRTARIAELNLTNGLLISCVRIAVDVEAKFNKETRIWALVVLNRGCQHMQNDTNIRTFQIALSHLPPSFMKFILSYTDPEDPDFSMNSKLIFQTFEQMCAAKNAQVL
jgi:hypothetical protein